MAPYVRRTPVLDTDLGLLKAESLQVTGSFKPRGAFNKVLRLLEAARDGGPPVTGLAAVSSGNHAQAVALAGRTLGLPVAVVMPEDSRPNKVAATRDLGATVVTEGVTVESRQGRLAELLDETGYQLVHPFDDWDVIHGQGTAALEILEDHPGVATVVVPVGGGGLISGTALVLKAAARPAGRPLRVIGAEPEQAPDAAESLRTRTHVHRPAGPTLADGARVPSVGERPFEVIVERGLVDDIVTVPEDAIAAAAVAMADRARLVVEPTGALAVAAVLAGLVPGRPDGTTVAYLSGGNIDPRRLSDLAATVHSA
ncbi:MAG TPA: pyridoxal-phosphate dependent enzyme [Acidimicrobiales bacterium]|nr:pyridoxal-phosphate dependent enzyme [Acidimicrobiales bacterium]